MSVTTTTEATGVANHARLERLAEAFGYDTSDRADWSLPLLKQARREFYARTKTGDRSYSETTYGTTITAEEIVSWVYMRWASKPEVTVESIMANDAPEASLRRWCINAADDLLQETIEARRIPGVSISTTSMSEPTDDGSDARESFVNPGEGGGVDGLAWVGNSGRFASIGAEDEFFAEADTGLSDELEYVWGEIAMGIIESVENETYRTALRAYVLEGLQWQDIEAKYGVDRHTGKKSYVRGVKDEGDIACLVVWRNLLWKGQEGTGRTPNTPKALPEKFLQAAKALGLDVKEAAENLL